MKSRNTNPLRTLPPVLAGSAALAAAWLLMGGGPPKPGPTPAARLLASLTDSSKAPHAALAPLEDGSLRHISAPSGTAFASPGTGAEEAGRQFLHDHAEALGIAGTGSKFTLLRQRDADGRHYLKFQQVCAGVPVFGAAAILQVNSSGGVEYAGNYLARDLPTAADAPQAKLSAGQAQEEASAHFFAESRGIPVSASPPELVWYAPSVLALPGEPRLAWKTGVRSPNPIDVNVLAFIDAETGTVLHRISYTCALLHRSIFDGNNDSKWPEQPPFPLPPYVPLPVRIEGGPSASMAQANDLFNYMGDVYNFYSSKHSRDSISHSGKPLFGVVRRCSPTQSCPMANAFWSGLPVASFPGIPGYSIDDGVMNFGDGWAKDDIVAHEYTHGVTQYESGLVYQNASGAINEAFSDIWGEFTDLGNGRGNDDSSVRWDVAEDLSGGAIRSMDNPPANGNPDRLGSSLFTTAASSPGNGNDFGGVHNNSGVINKLCSLLTDGGSFNGFTVTGLGVDRIARLFYEVNTNLLGPSADYTDLSAALHQAAGNLGWNASDQNNLHNAALAVEIVNNWADSANTRSSPNGCRRPGASSGGPFRTLAAAAAALRSGDTLHIAAGNYPGAVTLTRPMKLSLSSGTAAVLGK